MGDNEKKDKQANSKQAPSWITIVTAILSLISALLVAFIGYFGSVRIAELQSQTSQAQLELQNAQLALQSEVESLNASIREAEVALEQRRFDAEQQARRDEIMTAYIPKLLSSDETERDVATAVLFVIYPNEAKSILGVVAASLADEESAAVLDQVIRRAVSVDTKVGDWAIAIGNDVDLTRGWDRLRAAEEQGYAPVIYLRKGWYYTTVGLFSTQMEAESANIAVRSSWESASVVNLNSWCPEPQQKTEQGIDYFECPSAGLYHIVREGETLSEIAVRYGVAVEVIVEINNMLSNTIYAGQVLYIPVQ